MKNKIKSIICMALMVCLMFGLTTTSFAQVRIDKNKSYKAAWKINTYELKLDANDGRGIIENRKVKYKDSYGKLPDINRDYYDLIGWFDSPDGGQQVSKDTKMAASDTTIYAHWQARYVDVDCTNYVGVYDGQPHQPSVTTNIPGVTFTYGTSDGNYNMSSMPTFTDAGNYTVYWQATHSDCLTTTGSVNVTIEKAEAWMSIDTSNGYIAVSSNSEGTISATSSNTSIVNNVAIEGRSVKVLPTKYGSAGTVDITVNVGETKNYKSISAVQSVTVSSRLIPGNTTWWNPDGEYSYGYLNSSGQYHMDDDSMWRVTTDVPVGESGFYYILGYSGVQPKMCLFNSPNASGLYRAFDTKDGYAMYIPEGKYIKFSVCVGVGNTVNDLDFRKIVFN